jgi:ADP-heptose:LPS heptosyltransferase
LTYVSEGDLESFVVGFRRELVITIDTSIAHLAGALGKSVYVMLACTRLGATRENLFWAASLRAYKPAGASMPELGPATTG